MNLNKLNDLLATLPEAYKANALALVTRMGEVIEGIGDNPVGWRPPTAKLVQATSDRSKLPKGANMGDIIIGEEIMKKPTKVIVLRSWDARQYWSPDQNEAKMLCSSPDAKLGYIGLECNKCPHSVYDDEAKSIDCNKIKVFMVVAEDLSDVFLINFAKTSFKIGGEWQALMKKAGVAPYRRVYGLNSETSKAYKNVETFSIETFEGENRNTGAELLDFVTELFNQVGADRTESLKDFHTIVLARKSNPELLAAPTSGSDSDLAIPSDDEEALPKSTEPAPKSATAKKYSV